MHKIVYTTVDTHVHYYGYVETAHREAAQDRLAALAESEQPRRQLFYTRILTYLCDKLHKPSPASTQDALSAAEPIRSAK